MHIWKPRQTLGKIQKRISENPNISSIVISKQKIFIQLIIEGFHFAKFSPDQDMKAREKIFCFFYKITSFQLNKKRDDIWSAYVYFNFFHETVNSHNLGTANHIAHVIFVLYSAMKTLIDQSKRTYYPNYFINIHKFLNASLSLKEEERENTSCYYRYKLFLRI